MTRLDFANLAAHEIGELTEAQREKPRGREHARVKGEDTAERRGSREAGIAETLHPGHRVVERVVAPVPAAEAQLRDGCRREAEERRRVAGEARQVRHAGRLRERPAGSSRVAHEAQHVGEESSKPGRRARVEIVRPDGRIHVDESEGGNVPAREALLEPLRGAEHAGLFTVEEREHDRARRLPAALTESRESVRRLEHGRRAGRRIDRSVDPGIDVVADDHGRGQRVDAGNRREDIAERGVHPLSPHGHPHARGPRTERVGRIEEALPVGRTRRARHFAKQRFGDVTRDRERRNFRERVDASRLRTPRVAGPEEVLEKRAARDGPPVRGRARGVSRLDDALVARFDVDEESRDARALGRERLHAPTDALRLDERDLAAHVDARFAQRLEVFRPAEARVDDRGFEIRIRRVREKGQLVLRNGRRRILGEGALVQVERARSGFRERERKRHGLPQIDLVHVVPCLQARIAEPSRDLVRDRGVRWRARPVRALRESFERFADPLGRHEPVDVGTETREKRPSCAEDDESGPEDREHRDGGRDDGDASNLDVLRLAFSC